MKAQQIPGVVGHLEINYQLVDAQRWALLCHPHPLYHGSMHNKVITSCAKACVNAGVSWCSFNFRGVGRSENEYNDLHGAYLDALAVLSWLELNFCVPSIVLGFSFGAYIAQQLVILQNLKQAVLIAPGVDKWPFSDYDNSYKCSIIHGSSDTIAQLSSAVNWVERQKVLPELVIVDNASHFFHKKLLILQEIINKILTKDN